MFVNVGSEPVFRLETESASFDFERTFHAEYLRIVRVIARVVQGPGRAEEIAVEVFWKLLQKSKESTTRRYGPGWQFR